MTTHTQTPEATAADAALKTRHAAMWALGDYAAESPHGGMPGLECSVGGGGLRRLGVRGHAGSLHR